MKQGILVKGSSLGCHGVGHGCGMVHDTGLLGHKLWWELYGEILHQEFCSLIHKLESPVSLPLCTLPDFYMLMLDFA